MRFRYALLVAGAVVPVLAASVASASVPAHAGAAADPPSADSIAATLDIPPVAAAGIPGFTGTWAGTNAGPSGGTDVAYLPSSNAMSSYVSVAVGTSTSIGTPSVEWLAQTNITRGAGPSLIAGGPHLVTEFPEIHTAAKCTIGHPATAAAHATQHVVTISGQQVLENGPPVTETVSGAALGLAPKVATADLTFSLTSVTQTTDNSYAHADVILTVAGTLYGPGGDELYDGRLATLTWGDVTADCTTGPTTADVRVLKSAPEEAPQGKEITYNLDVVNYGPGTAADVVVTDEIADYLTVVSVPSECKLAGKTLTCDLGSMGFGESKRVTYTALAAADAPVNTELENCGAVSSTTPQESEDGKESCTGTTVVPDPANVSVVKSGPATALPGGLVAYDFTVTNHGPDPADHVEFSDVIPAELTDISVPPGCALAGRTVTCLFGALGVNGSRTFTVTATVAAGTADGTAIQNCATVTTTTPQTDETNDWSCLQTITGTGPAPPATDIEITKAGPATVEQGGNASYTLTIRNRGTVDAAGTEVTDVLPDYVTVIDVPAGCTLAGRTLTCTVGTLAAGASAAYTVPVRVSADAPAGYNVENCGTATTTTPDEDPGACTAATVADDPATVTNLATAKTGPSSAAPGAVINYTLTVTNRSGVTAHGTVLGDVFPDEVTVTGIPSGCSLSGGRSLACTIGRLPGGATRTYLVSAVVGSGLAPRSAFQNCAAAYTTTTETDLSDNPSCVQTTVSAAAPFAPVTG